uniref:Lipid phosphate phosphatase 2 n=1 Tax=Anthurium amnicola TaxID=1678845 RepID=A0A1D1XEG1_9ARAE
MVKFSKLELLKAYALDWVLCFVFLGVFFIVDKAEPFHRRFSLEDKTIQFPFAESERVPMWMCAIITVIVPFIVMTVVALAIKKSLHDWHHASLGLLMGLTLTLMVTEVFKNTVGRPRPDFIDRCRPIAGATDPVLGLSDDKICTRTELLKDGFKSFLSGHSSNSFAGMGFLSLYLAGKLHVFDRKGYTYKGFVVGAPLVVATLIAVSRTEDYRHHWQDVLAGGLVGFFLSYFAYKQYYPSLHSPVSDKPYSVRLVVRKPEYKADFSFIDGSEVEITVVKNDEQVIYRDNRVLLPDSNSTTSNSADNIIVSS